MREPLMNIMIQAAYQAEKAISRNLHKMDRMKHEQNSSGEWITPFNQMAEDLIIAELKKAYPAYGVQSVANGHQGNEENYFLIDPINGSHNLLNQNPHWCISIALKEKGKLTQALIFDPSRDEMFSASVGGGAYLNKQRIRVSKQKELNNALVATSVPFRSPEDKKSFWSHTARLSSEVRELRMTGSIALDFAWTACGRFDAYYEFGLNSFNSTAGILLIQEAGGSVQTMNGKEVSDHKGNLVASGVYLMPKLLKYLR